VASGVHLSGRAGQQPVEPLLELRFHVAGARELVDVELGEAGERAARHLAAAVADAFGATFWWTLGFTVLAVIPAALLPGRPREAAAAPARAEPATA
jgi:hypothetical protein